MSTGTKVYCRISIGWGILMGCLWVYEGISGQDIPVKSPRYARILHGQYGVIGTPLRFDWLRRAELEVGASYTIWYDKTTFMVTLSDDNGVIATELVPKSVGVEQFMQDCIDRLVYRFDCRPLLNPMGMKKNKWELSILPNLRVIEGEG